MFASLVAVHCLEMDLSKLVCLRRLRVVVVIRRRSPSSLNQLLSSARDRANTLRRPELTELFCRLYFTVRASANGRNGPPARQLSSSGGSPHGKASEIYDGLVA